MRTRTLKGAVVVLVTVLVTGCGSSSPGVDGGGGGGGDDVTSPSLTASVPAHGATDVPVSSPLSFEFSEAMNTASVRVAISPDVSLGLPTWEIQDTLLRLTPAADLSFGTTFAVSISGQDLAGNILAATLVTFTTQTSPDLVPPTVVATTPPDQAANVAADTRLSVTFSKAMETGTVSLTLNPAYDPGTPEWTSDNKTVSFNAPPAPLANGTPYTVDIAGKDLGGRDLSGSTRFGFSTGADATRPTVLNTSPANNAAGVPSTTNISVTFSEPMNRASAQGAFSATPAVSCTFTWDSSSKLMTCQPQSSLGGDTSYSVRIATGAQDVAGNALAADFTFFFRTALVPDTTPPTLVSSTPANNATGASPFSNITVLFSEPMDQASVQNAFAITNPSGFAGGVLSWNTAGTEMTYDPPATLPYGATVTWRINSQAQDLAGNALQGAPQLRSFRVVQQATVTITSTGSLDGSVSSNGSSSTSGTQALVGDDSNDFYRNVFLRFNLSSLPTTLTAITSATLYVNLASSIGNPFTELGTLQAESVSFTGAPDVSALAAPVLAGESRALATSCCGYRFVTATAKVNDDWANRANRGTQSQYRLRFVPTDSSADGNSDALTVTMGDSFTNEPYLQITYEYP
ncbi:MAG: Ig-like domain-containing protein [Myxococcota bacterium]